MSKSKTTDSEETPWPSEQNSKDILQTREDNPHLIVKSFLQVYGIENIASILGKYAKKSTDNTILPDTVMQMYAEILKTPTPTYAALSRLSPTLINLTSHHAKTICHIFLSCALVKSILYPPHALFDLSDSLNIYFVVWHIILPIGHAIHRKLYPYQLRDDGWFRVAQFAHWSILCMSRHTWYHDEMVAMNNDETIDRDDFISFQTVNLMWVALFRMWIATPIEFLNSPYSLYPPEAPPKLNILSVINVRNLSQRWHSHAQLKKNERDYAPGGSGYHEAEASFTALQKKR